MIVSEKRNDAGTGIISERDATTHRVNPASKKTNPSSALPKKTLKELPPQLIRFQVTLENPHRIFFAGEELKGNIEIDLSENLPIQGIILRIVGEAYVNVSDEPRPWSGRKMNKIKSTLKGSRISPSISERIDLTGKFGEFSVPFCFGSDPSAKWETLTTTTVTCPRSQRSTLQRDQQVPAVVTKKSSLRRQEEANKRFRSHEKYFEYKAYVFGHKYSSTREMMWMGKHSFPFTYTLPSKLPASFHGRFGYVRYFCEASLERLGLPTIQRSTFFSVSTITDLNTDSKADSGVSKGKKTNSWCFCCASGTVIVSTKVKRRGFVPGETIPIQAHILNVSNKTIARVSAKVIQIATYYSSKAFRNHADETIVSEMVRGSVPPGESSTWESEGPKVPPVPPTSTMIDCKLITVGYRLDIPRITSISTGITFRMPNAPQQPVITDDLAVYAPRYITYREIGKQETKAKPTQKQSSALNGGVLSESSLKRHLVICVSPASHNRRITPCSATRLISDGVSLSDSSSVWNSPISVKSVPPKSNLPAMSLDLIKFISDPKPKRSEKYNRAIQELMRQDKMNDEEKTEKF